MAIEITSTHVISTSRRRLLLTSRWTLQAAIVVLALALLVWFGVAVREALAKKGVEFSFSYLWTTANISLSEGLTLVFDGYLPNLAPFNASDTNLQALLAGLWNTLKVALTAIVLSTLFGTLVGIGRLSTNWLVRKLSFGLVECIRNTPLLIQIVFWYFAVVLRFPPASAASDLFGVMIASQSGVFLPAVIASEAANPSSWSLLAATCVALFAFIPFRRRKGAQVILALSIAALIGAVLSGFPLALEFPKATRFGASGGTALSPEVTAILVAIVVNSSAYVSEIVRGAIDSLPKGQWEAAASLGLPRSFTLRDVILPQVFRIVLPSLGNRYISLTKDTSLGIAIGYPDLFNVYGTVSNQTGRNLEGVIIVMVTYLILSWVISACVNAVNARVNATRTSR
ncbi:His/Glu/Gln/Arg/opine family amino acid ABC transporter permease subunit [Bradyrhizobium sp. CIR48]|uniref:ABC transporter permease subunit n=1 Tax=Bradyrhizobium sp. CIR48 TaxID=2663840 RepID=UPI001606BC7F|nr:ABC transporter permease subunit [Bradyrhizobium sp. CIR48]MBB4427595.1 His/Glu/Gln/Arg/opine family amino acid ABC transporter permease subunit [Bradyrhizobium sp. CIR48]